MRVFLFLLCLTAAYLLPAQEAHHMRILRETLQSDPTLGTIKTKPSRLVKSNRREYTTFIRSESGGIKILTEDSRKNIVKNTYIRTFDSAGKMMSFESFSNGKLVSASYSEWLSPSELVVKNYRYDLRSGNIGKDSSMNYEIYNEYGHIINQRSVKWLNDSARESYRSRSVIEYQPDGKISRSTNYLTFAGQPEVRRGRTIYEWTGSTAIKRIFNDAGEEVDFEQETYQDDLLITFTKRRESMPDYTINYRYKKNRLVGIIVKNEGYPAQETKFIYR